MAEKMNTYVEALKFGLNPTGYLVQKGAEALIIKAQGTGTVNEIEEEARKQELQYQMLEGNAKISQELAIAQRINTADEVEIEEYFEGEGQGEIGVQVKDKNVNIGGHGHGRKIVKRVYKFKGWHGNELEVMTQHNNVVDKNHSKS